MIAFFGVSFASFLSGLAIAWFHWSRPLSLASKIAAGQFIVGCVLSGVFLLTAKSVTPEGNRKRMMALLFVFLVFQMIIDVLR